MPSQDRHRFQTSFRWVRIFTFWRFGFKQSSFRHITRVIPARRLVRLSTAAGFLACCCPPGALSDRGKPSDPGMFLQIPPYLIGDTTERLAAHQAIATARKRANSRGGRYAGENLIRAMRN